MTQQRNGCLHATVFVWCFVGCSFRLSVCLSVCLFVRLFVCLFGGWDLWVPTLLPARGIYVLPAHWHGHDGASDVESQSLLPAGQCLVGPACIIASVV